MYIFGEPHSTRTAATTITGSSDKTCLRCTLLAGIGSGGSRLPPPVNCTAACAVWALADDGARARQDKMLPKLQPSGERPCDYRCLAHVLGKTDGHTRGKGTLNCSAAGLAKAACACHALAACQLPAELGSSENFAAAAAAAAAEAGIDESTDGATEDEWEDDWEEGSWEERSGGSGRSEASGV